QRRGRAAAGRPRPPEEEPEVRGVEPRQRGQRGDEHHRVQLPPQGARRPPRARGHRPRARRRVLLRELPLRLRQAGRGPDPVEFVCEDFLYGFPTPAAGPIPSSSPSFFPKDAPKYPFDKKKAEALLDEAGYKKGADGKRFSIRLVPAPWGEDITLWSTFIQQSLQQVGIGVEIVRYDAAGFLSNVYKDWNFDLATGWHQYRGDPAVSTTVWYRSGSPKGAPWTNQWGWQSEQVDKLIDAAAFETDPARRRQLYADWVKRVNEEIPLW